MTLPTELILDLADILATHDLKSLQNLTFFYYGAPNVRRRLLKLMKKLAVQIISKAYKEYRERLIFIDVPLIPCFSSWNIIRKVQFCAPHGFTLVYQKSYESALATISPPSILNVMEPLPYNRLYASYERNQRNYVVQLYQKSHKNRKRHSKKKSL